jgi:hypothetical protein
MLHASRVPNVQVAFGTFIVAFLGNSFVENAKDSSLVTGAVPDPALRRQSLVLLYFSMILVRAPAARALARNGAGHGCASDPSLP